ncbi:MAG: Dabb family protein [Dehalococcoidia bacterium]|nr:MAG: Dabb family protein [Dehalococcoidia bacterium]
MFLHNVYFWMESDLDDDALRAFEQGLRTLCENPPAILGYYGKPAEAHRDVVDGSFSYGLHVTFEDRAGQDAYQVGEVHQRFVADHAAKWARVLVYDTEVS